MRLAAAPAIIAVSAVLLALAPSWALAQPRVTASSLREGALLAEPPPNIQLCFAEPVDVADGADFKFDVIMPGDVHLGLRIVYQPDGMGVVVQTGIPEDAPDGDWTFEWRVSDAVTKEPASGSISFEVGDGGSPVPPREPIPPACGQPGSASNPGSTPSEEDGDDGTDVLTPALIAAGAVAAAAAVLLVLYLVRRRSARRRPPPGGSAGGGNP